MADAALITNGIISLWLQFQEMFPKMGNDFCPAVGVPTNGSNAPLSLPWHSVNSIFVGIKVVGEDTNNGERPSRVRSSWKSLT